MLVLHPISLSQKKEETEIKKNYSEIPDEVSRILTDEAISLIDRIKYAEERKSEGWYSYNKMLELLSIPNTTYSRYLRVIRSNNKRLYNRVASGKISVTTACDFLRMPKYPFYERLESINADILYIASRYAIYVYQDQCYFAIASKKRDHSDTMKEQYWERLYLIDRKSYAIDTIIQLIEEGYVIRQDLRFSKGYKESTSTLRHYIYAAYHSVNLDVVANDGVWFIKPPTIKEVTDLRISNLKGSLDIKIPAITGHTAMVKRGKDIVITRKVDGLVAYLDYSPELFRVLKCYGALHTKANDNRLCLYIDDKHDIYLYHLRMIEHLYGLPHDTEGLIANIDRFRAEQLSQKRIVDHLDNDCSNNRLSNLMLMTLGDNNRKAKIMQDIKNLGLPYFCWAERYDDTAITLRAGYMSQFKQPYFITEGVFTVGQFLEEARTFADTAREQLAVREAFDDLERRLNSKDNNTQYGGNN